MNHANFLQLVDTDHITLTVTVGKDKEISIKFPKISTDQDVEYLQKMVGAIKELTESNIAKVTFND